MDYHHVIEAAGIVVLGLVFYSYTGRWLEAMGRTDRRWRMPFYGLAFGLLSIVLMTSRIQVGPGVFIDARAIPIALVTLAEGGWAGLVGALVAAAYRVWLGGSGAVAGVVGILGTVAVATLGLAWARREGGVRSRHAFALGGGVFVVTFASFLVLGARGVEMFSRDWLPLLVVSVVGVGGFARLFTEVAAAQAMEAARRDAAELRAVTLLARAAAHEINNPLMIVIGGLAILAKRLQPGGEDAQWVTRAKEGAEKIRDIVARMNTITQVEAVTEQGLLPPMLDIRKSSGPG